MQNEGCIISVALVVGCGLWDSFESDSRRTPEQRTTAAHRGCSATLQDVPLRDVRMLCSPTRDTFRNVKVLGSPTYMLDVIIFIISIPIIIIIRFKKLSSRLTPTPLAGARMRVYTASDLVRFHAVLCPAFSISVGLILHPLLLRLTPLLASQVAVANPSVVTSPVANRRKVSTAAGLEKPRRSPFPLAQKKAELSTEDIRVPTDEWPRRASVQA